jgi:hypothetical protein
MKISFAKVIKSDYLSLLLLLLPIVGVLLLIDAQFFGIVPGLIKRGRGIEVLDPMFFLGFAIVCIVVCLPILWNRFRAMQRHFDTGFDAMATITEVMFYKDRGRVTFSYLVNGQHYSTGNAIHKNVMTASFQVGQPLAIVVSSTNPEKAYIKALYTV